MQSLSCYRVDTGKLHFDLCVVCLLLTLDHTSSAASRGGNRYGKKVNFAALRKEGTFAALKKGYLSHS